MSFMTDLVYFLSYFISLSILLVCITSIKHKILNLVIFCVVAVIGYLYGTPFIRLINHNYRFYNVPYIIIIILLSIVFLISLINIDECYDYDTKYNHIHKIYLQNIRNKELKHKTLIKVKKHFIHKKCLLDHKLNIYNDCYIILSLILCYVSCLYYLSTLGLSYLYTTNSNRIAKGLESISILSLSLVVMFMMYTLGGFVVYDKSKKHFLRSFYRTYLRKYDWLYLLLSFIFICLSFNFYYRKALSFSLLNNIYASKISIQYYNKTSNHKYYITHLRFRDGSCGFSYIKNNPKLVRSYIISNDNLICKLKSNKLKWLLNDKNNINFSLSKFTRKGDYFQYCNNKSKKPVIIKLNLYKY